jgi:DNA-binding IclR family transcriptional regulator
MERSFDDANATLWRIRGEYREMPGLKLTVRQAARLWHLDPPSIERLLNVLVADGLLRRTSAGAYLVHAEHRVGS